MATRLSTPSYDVETYPDRELLRGRYGRYYVVDLKNAASGVRYYFEGGKYTLVRGTQEFRASLNTFVGDVLSKFEGKVNYQLFVRAAPTRGLTKARSKTARNSGATHLSGAWGRTNMVPIWANASSMGGCAIGICLICARRSCRRLSPKLI